MKKNFPFHSSFSSVVKTVIAKEKDKYLSLASIENLKPFLPDVNVSKDIDLLPICANGFVVNRVNANRDVINTKTALEIYKSFINRPINAEHDRNTTCGVILTAGFSEFGTDKPLTEEEAAKMTGPFNCVVGGVLWRIVNDNITNYVEDCSDPTSSNYLGASFSWELGLESYALVALNEGEKDIENGEIIDNEDKIKELEAKAILGKIEDGRMIYRMPNKGVLPLGMGITENPAADVSGILAKTENTIKANNAENIIEEKIEANNIDIITKKEEIISHSNNDIVKIDRKGMKISKIEDITEETLKEIKATDLTSFYNDKFQEAAVKFQEKENAHEKAIAQIQELETKQSSMATELKTATEELAKIRDEQAKAAALEVFNQRMTYFNDTYELDAEDRKIVASDIQNLTNELFDAYKAKMEKLLAGKNKETIKASKEIKASAETSKEEISTELDKSKEQKASIPNTIETQKESLADRAKRAFNKENIVITNK